MNTPSVVKLMAQRITVKRVPEITHVDQNGRQMEAWGLWDSTLNVISIRTDQGPDRERSTFLHENLHAMLNFAGFENADSEEELVTRLAPVILSWLRENPRVITYLTEKT